jgi:putative heme-binding domain-containing protein
MSLLRLLSHRRLVPLVLAVLVLLPGVDAPVQSADDKPARLELKPGDHISIIGNTLADRMQHDGWLETYFHSRFPQHDLTFRNLGFAADEVTMRQRSANFGTPDKWLAMNKTDVVFAFFGYNESFGGEAGLAKFKTDLDSLVKYTVGQKYNGKSNARMVLFSPIAHEDLHDRNLPDGKENNKRLEIYTKAMAEVAKANNIPFVDLFHPTLALYPKVEKPLTINGIHLTPRGDEAVAKIIDAALFAEKVQREPKELERLRQAVADKNFHWFERYRTTDGYSIFGGRGGLKFMDGQTNSDVAFREMEVLDVLTANRDQRIWAVAKGRDLKVNDDNTPPFLEVKTNKPGPLAGGAHLFLNGEEAIKKMTLAKGLKITLFAEESMFPELAKPVQMAFDAKGRMWVAVWPSYPHWKPKEEMNDKLLILEDTKGAGKADKCTIYAGGLHNPTGFEFYNGGVLVAQVPDIMYLKDSKGGDQADTRIRVLDGMDSADTHHSANSFTLDPGGALYWQEGTFHHTQVETPYGPPVRCINAGVFRYEPRTQKFDTYISSPFANPHGHVFDRWGQDIVVDGTGAPPYDAALFSGHLDFPAKHPHPPQVYQQRTRPCPGIEILTSKHFPAEFQGNLLVPNVIGFQGILRYKLADDGASIHGTELEPLVFSSDPNFRPSDLKVGPDGAIYFLDWQNPIIGHMQHNLRDPSRDRKHGRIYKITYEGREPSKSPAIAGEPIEKLLGVLKSPEDRVRYRAKIELGARNSDDVIAAVQKWIPTLDPKDADYEHQMMEGLWVHQYHNVVDVDLLKRMLGSKDLHARAAATRVLCYWRDRVPAALALLKKQAADPEPRVRLEAIRAASFFTVPEAIEVVFISDDQPTDQYLTFTRNETMKAIEPYFQRAVKEKTPLHFTTAAGARYFLKNISTDDLLKQERTDAVYLELLFRKGVRDEFRREALTGLAKSQKKKEVEVLVSTIRNQDGTKNTQDESVAYDLVRLLTNRNAAELTEARSELEALATDAKTPLMRELGYVALIAADGNVDKAWALASKSASSLQDLVSAMPLIRDPSQRALLYPKVEPLIAGLPKELTSGDSKETKGRYVRIELPGANKTLTLAEVEVYSGGKNVARQGKATQSSTSNGGDAGKALDGNTSGKYGDGGQTHTAENTRNPWWEVDLGKEVSIESITIYNRTDDGLGKRLNGFTLKVLDKDKRIIFQKTKITAPTEKGVYPIGAEPAERAIRRAAMNGLTSVRGKETDAFKTLAKYASKDETRAEAVNALVRIPSVNWPKEEAMPLLDSLLATIKKLPASERTSDDALNVLQFSYNLAALLPLAEAKAVRQELGELGVQVIRMATLPEQMSYDKDRIVVKAGKPFEIVFENTDLMPHNLVVTQPGALEKIGVLAENTAQQPGAAERQYVPVAPEIMYKSRLLAPREVQRLSFMAPSKPGVYPIVCTYPGHWRRMYSALYVVEDLDEYLADAESYLKSHPLDIKDELLKFNRPRKEWKYEELVDEVKQLKDGRSFSNAKYLFQMTSCVGCHKMNGVGNEFGPDLTKLDPKQDQLEEILRDVLEPSFRINEKYKSYKFDLKNGKTITGLLLDDKGPNYTVIENPLANAKPTLIKKDDIDEKTESKVSIMPKGLLDKLTKEEILDLIAYIKAKGDAKSPLFQGGHEHHH